MEDSEEPHRPGGEPGGLTADLWTAKLQESRQCGGLGDPRSTGQNGVQE